MDCDDAEVDDTLDFKSSEFYSVSVLSSSHRFFSFFVFPRAYNLYRIMYNVDVFFSI